MLPDNIKSKQNKNISKVLAGATKRTNKTEKVLINEMTIVYNNSLKDIKSQISSFIEKYGVNDELSQAQAYKYNRLVNLEKTINEELNNLNKTVNMATDNHLINAYKDNYYSTAFALESASQFKIGYNKLDTASVRKALHTPLDKLAISNNSAIVKQNIKRSLATAIAQGEGFQKTTKRIQKDLEKNANNARRIAVTEQGRIMNSARFEATERADNKGLQLTKTWIATIDDRTRDSHASLEGETVKFNETFSNGLLYPNDPAGPAEEVINCFLADTKIATNSKIINGYKHKYKGDLVTIETSSGIKLTATPNHPILTNKGWVAIGLIDKTYKVAKTSIPNNWFSRINPYIECIDTTIGDIYNSIKSIGHSKRVAGALVDFHGYIPDTDVEVVFLKGFLLNGIKTFFNKKIKDKLFKFTDFMFRFLISFGFVKKFLSCCRFTASNLIRFTCKTFAFIKRSLLHTNIHRFASVSDMDIVIDKAFSDSTSTTIMKCGKFFDRNSIKILFDDVVNIEIDSVNTHVYNLHTKNNIFVASNSISEKQDNVNGIIVHNCRCDYTEGIEGYPSPVTERSARDAITGKSKIIKATDVEQWKKERLSR